jgi:hypothetical protein
LTSKTVSAPSRWPHFLRSHPFYKVDVQQSEDLFGCFRRKVPLALQYVMEVWLRNAGHPGQSALGELAAAHAFAQRIVRTKDREKPLEFLKVHLRSSLHFISI